MKSLIAASLTALGLTALGLASSMGTATADPPPPTCDGLVATIVGTDGDDTITVTGSTAQVVAGLKGNDTITGNTGNDVICGGKGDDLIQGHGGTDRLFGQQGADILDGGVGGCCPSTPNTGDDHLSGGQGADTLHSSDAPTTGSTLHGNQGPDLIFLYSGGWAHGGNGSDEMHQFARDAVLDGGNGADTLTDDNDGALTNENVTLLGGNGDDSLTSTDTASISTLDGANGTDTCAGGDTMTNCAP